MEPVSHPVQMVIMLKCAILEVFANLAILLVSYVVEEEVLNALDVL